ncbi:MAG: glycosyltransferase, partial [Planctomycetota bacterium]
SEALTPFSGSIRVLTKENGGVSSARNAGLALVETERVAFLDSDDALHPEALRRAGEILNSDADACLLAARKMDSGALTGETMTKPGAAPLYSLEGLFGPEESYAVPTGVFPTATIRELGGFDERLVGAEDYLLLLRLVASGVRLGIVREPSFDKDEGEGERLSSHAVRNVQHKLRALRLFRELEPVAARQVAAAMRDREGRYLARLGRSIPTLSPEEGGPAPGSREPARLLFEGWRLRPLALDVLAQAISASIAPRRFHRRRSGR